MNTAADPQARRASVATGLFLSGLGMSMLAALMIAAVLLFALRAAELGAIDRRYDEIERAHLQALSAGLWAVDPERVRVGFDAITQLQDIGRLELEDERGERLGWRAPDLRSVHSQRSFELVHREFDQPLRVGLLHVELTSDRVNAAFWREAGLIFASVLGSLLAALLVLQGLFRHRVGRHLEALADYASTMNPETLGRPLVLARPPSVRPDELDTVAQALDEMGRSLRQEFVSRSQMLKERKRPAVSPSFLT